MKGHIALTIYPFKRILLKLDLIWYLKIFWFLFSYFSPHFFRDVLKILVNAEGVTAFFPGVESKIAVAPAASDNIANPQRLLKMDA